MTSLIIMTTCYKDSKLIMTGLIIIMKIKLIGHMLDHMLNYVLDHILDHVLDHIIIDFMTMELQFI